VGFGQEEQAMACCPPRGGNAVPAIRQRRSTRRRGDRGDPQLAAATLGEWQRGPGAAERDQQLFHLFRPGSRIDPEELILLVPVSHADDTEHPTRAHVIEHRQVFSQPHRVIEQTEKRGDHNRGGLRAGSHGRRQEQGRRQVAVRR
jgi:hypothetical protein